MAPSKKFQNISKRLVSKLRAYFFKAKKKKAAIGISGGVDSALVAALAVRALGAKNVLGLVLPASATQATDVRDALLLSRKLGIAPKTIVISPIISQFVSALEEEGESLSKVSSGNIAARIRMSLLYAVAGENDALVLGTGDKSELTLGYFTKYGDGGCDLLVIGSLYKTEVRELALELGVPKQIALKPSSPGFWKGHTAEGELGASYEDLDRVMRLVLTGKKIPAKDKMLAKLVLERKKISGHKLKLPPIL